MELIITVAEVTAPVFLLATIGFVWVKAGFDYRIEFVTRLAMTLSVPCLIFVALMETTIDPTALRDLSLAALVAYTGIFATVWCVCLVMKLEMRSYLAPLVFGNTGNVGLPLALFAFGETGLAFAVVVFAIMAVASFSIGLWIVSGSGSLVPIIREPILVGTVLGALFLWQEWQTPAFLTNTLRLIGQMAIPLMLITLGVAVARLSASRLSKAFWLSLGKAAICATIGWSVGRYFELSPVALAVLVLQVTTPVAVTSYLLAEKYGADSQAVAGLVVISTLLSVIILPILLFILI